MLQVCRLAAEEIEPPNVLGGEQPAHIAGIGRPAGGDGSVLILLDLAPHPRVALRPGRSAACDHRHRHDPSKNLVGFVVGDVALRGRHRARAGDREPARRRRAAARAARGRRASPTTAARSCRSSTCARASACRRPTATRRTKWIVVDVAGRLVALVVDAVTEVFGTGGAELRPAPSLGGGDDVRGIAGVTTHEGGLVFVLGHRAASASSPSRSPAGRARIGPATRRSACPEGRRT